MAIATYEGNEPYIFVSYAHKDSDVVLPIIEALADNGFRVWYDAGITAGTDYTEDIAGRILNSTVVIAFVSKLWMQSQFCLREIKFAVSQGKNILPIYLDDVVLTPGIEMILNAPQALFYNRVPYETFLKKLLEAPLLCPCRSAGAAVTSTQSSKITTAPSPQTVMAQNVPVDTPAEIVQKPVVSLSSDFNIIGGVLKKYVGKAAVVVIPDGVTGIGEYAFAWCNSLTDITISNRVKYIDPDAFHRCSCLQSVTIPDSVTSIERYAFSDCKSLTRITIPAGVTDIRTGVFYGCESLTDITISNSVTSIGEKAFCGCKSLINVTIPNSVTRICQGAFSGCESLTSITIPRSVTHVGDDAFECCPNLTIYLKPFSSQEYWNKKWNSGNRPVKWRWKK